MSQETSILRHLESGKKLTALQALKKYGCFRLASRINKIKKTDPYWFTVQTEMITTNSKRVARYFIKK